MAAFHVLPALEYIIFLVRIFPRHALAYLAGTAFVPTIVIDWPSLLTLFGLLTAVEAVLDHRRAVMSSQQHRR